ncbi:MAG: HEAT repeat domain-containing protein [Chloroflexota bacterium]
MKEDLHILANGSDEEREEASHRIAVIGAESISLLKDLLKGDEDVRWWVMRTCSMIDHHNAVQLLTEGLDDADEDVAVCAAMALGEQGKAETVEVLLQHLLSFSSYGKRHVADALSKIGEPSVDGLIALLQDNCPDVRTQAARALSRIKAESSIPALIAALDDAEAAVSHYAWEALQQMGVGTVFFNP